MKSKPLLNNIKSKDNLKQIFLFSYFDFNSALKFIKYNKSLQNKLDINIKNYNFNYKYKKKIEKNQGFFIILSFANIFNKVIMLIFFLIYLILFYAKDSFIDENTKKDYDINKKKFIAKMNNSLIEYLIFILISILWSFLCLIRKITFKSVTKLIIFIFILLIDLIYYILLCIKYNYSNDIILKDENNKSVDCWFMNFDFSILVIIPIFYITFILLICCIQKCKFDNIGDEITFILNQFKGVNIIDFELPLNFGSLNNKEKNNLILKTSKNYKYKLNKNQINLIKKINEIRRKNNISLLKYNTTETIPDFIINEVTEVNIYNYKNNFRLKNYLYLFRYEKNEFQNFIENSEILSIINNDLLNEIIIIEQNDIEYISIYNSSNLNDIQNSYSISNNESEILESSDRNIKTIKINENYFQK